MAHFRRRRRIPLEAEAPRLEASAPSASSGTKKKPKQNAPRAANPKAEKPIDKSGRSRKVARAAAPRGDVTSSRSPRVTAPQPSDKHRRHELSSLVPPRAIAPDADAVGEELIDREALEVPIGHSADPAIDGELSHELPQPESTVASLLSPAEFPGMFEQKNPTIDEGELTARPMSGLLPPDDAYDAVAPDELGSEWLARATEAGLGGYDSEREVRLADVFIDSGMSVVSEGSFSASYPDPSGAAESDSLDSDSDASAEEFEREAAESNGSAQNRKIRRTPRESLIAPKADVVTNSAKTTGNGGGRRR
jgi:hypothetical protein